MESNGKRREKKKKKRKKKQTRGFVEVALAAELFVVTVDI